MLVVGSDDKVAYREVALGPTHEGLRIVVKGLEPGDRVVVSGLQRVRPGMLVQARPATMEEPT